MPPKTGPEGQPVYVVKRDGSGYKIGIPAEIGKMIEDRSFAFSLTEQGFSYTPYIPFEGEGLPEWLRGD